MPVNYKVTISFHLPPPLPARSAEQTEPAYSFFTYADPLQSDDFSPPPLPALSAEQTEHAYSLYMPVNC